MATITTTQPGATPNPPRKPVPGLFSSLPTTIPRLQAIRKALRIPAPSPNPSNAGNGRSSAMTATLAIGTGPQNSTTNTINGNQNNMCQVWRWTAPLVIFLTLYPQNCHVYPRRLDPASGVLHSFCSRSCAKANSTAVKCEVLYNAAVSDQTVVWLTHAFPFRLCSTAKSDRSIPTESPHTRTVPGLVPKLPNSTGTETPKATLMGTGRHRNRVPQCRYLPLPPVQLRAVSWPYT